MAKILKQHGIESGPERGRHMPWSTFLKFYCECLAATDFFTLELRGLRGFVTFYLLIVIELSTRRVHLAGITPNPNSAWIAQVGRNLTGPEGELAGKRFIILDRDCKFCDAFRTMLTECRTERLRLPPRRPKLNAHCERLEKIIFFDDRFLPRATRSFLDHNHEESNH